MQSPLERLRAAKALSETVAALSGMESVGAGVDLPRKVAMERRAESLRALLLGKRTVSLSDLDLFAGEATVRVLADHWDALRGDASPSADIKTAEDVLRIRAARHLKIITRFMVDVANRTSTGSGEGVPGLARLASEVDMHDQGHAKAYMAAELDRFVFEGEAVGQAVESMREAAREVDEIEARTKAMLAELDAAVREREEALKDMRAAAYESYDLRDAGKITGEEAARIREVYTKAHEEWSKRLRARFAAREDELREERKDATLRYSMPAHELKRTILAGSRVSEAEANDWAAEQRVEASAVAALKRKGYDPQKLRADMAEFYRLTGGRLAAVKVRASRGRASANGIHGHKNRVISMGAHFDKRVLFHELGHHLEADPQVYAAARGFLLRRRESDVLYTLRKLTGNNAYGAAEVAYKGHWFNPYVGKHYDYDVTEVFSMGVESWCDEVTLANRMRQDPEHFKLIAGFMKAPPDALFGAVKKVLAQAADADADAEEAAEETLEQALKRLAAGVEFGPEPGSDSRKPYWMYGQRDGSYLGQFAGIDAWSVTKTQDPYTRRMRKGIVLIRWEDGGFRWIPAFSMTEAKAMARVWKETGKPQYLTNYKEVAALAASLA